MQLVYTLDRRSRARDGTQLLPWDMDPVRLRSLGTVPEMEAALGRLATVTRGMPRSFRREWLEDHLPTLRSLINVVRGRRPDLPHQLQDFYTLPPLVAKEAELEDLRASIRRVLHVPRADDLPAAITAWESDHRLRPGEVLPTMERCLRDARRETRRLLRLPRSERVELIPMRRSRNMGTCYYTHDFRSTVRLNADLPWTWPALRDMAAHEAYPGHHASQAVRETVYLRGGFPREAALGMAADPTGAVDEGLAENGLRFLHWDRAPEDRLTLLLNRLRWGVDVNLAWMSHRGVPWHERVGYASDGGLYDREGAGRAARYAAHPLWASYGFCYWYGTEVIRRKYEAMDGDAGFFDALYGMPYTIRQLERVFRRL